MAQLQPTITPSNERKLQWALIFIWLLIHTSLFYLRGVRYAGDTPNYLAYATEIAEQFHFANNYYLKYAGYPLFLAMIFKVGLGLTGVVVVQTLFSGFATICFYKATKLLAGNTLAPLLATFLLISWYDLQMFHAFILTESLYISLLLVAFYLLVRAQTVQQSLYALPVLLYVALVRPNGFIAVIAYAGYLFVHAYAATPAKRDKIILVLLITVVPLAAVLVVDHYLLREFTIVETYKKGEVIFMYKGLLVHSAHPIVMPAASASPLTKLYLFIRDNTSYFFRMSAWRFLLFWCNVKPFFLIPHNIAIAATLYPLYFFTGNVLAKNRLSAPLRAFVLLLLLQQAFITTVTSEDKTGRFLMSVVAFVFMFGAIGVSWFVLKRVETQEKVLT